MARALEEEQERGRGSSIQPLKKGECIRYLGFYLGHECTNDMQWEVVLNRINLAAAAWRTRGCTVLGRSEVLNAI